MWIFSKAMMDYVNSLCSQEQEVASSAEHCSAGAPSAQSKSTPTPAAYLSHVRTTERSRRSRYGMTFEHLTEDHGAALLMSYLGVFHARTSVSPVKAQASMETKAAFGAKWLGSFAKYDRGSCSWKTHQCSLFEGLMSCSVTWPKWGLMQDGECWEHTTLVRPTSATAFGLWPTPTVCGLYNRKGASKTSGDGLATAVRRFPTPTASAAKGWSRNHNRANTNDRLDYTVEREASKKAVIGRLNPTWVEWLMGWPIGWTGLLPLETGRFHEWRQQHGGCYQVSFRGDNS